MVATSAPGYVTASILPPFGCVCTQQRPHRNVVSLVENAGACARSNEEGTPTLDKNIGPPIRAYNQSLRGNVSDERVARGQPLSAFCQPNPN
jgi:hypothetical protein